VENKVHPH